VIFPVGLVAAAGVLILSSGIVAALGHLTRRSRVVERLLGGVLAMIALALLLASGDHLAWTLAAATTWLGVESGDLVSQRCGLEIGRKELKAASGAPRWL
jgi:hypothetical protein